MMTVVEFFKKARAAGLRGPAVMEARRWPGNSGKGTFELSMRNGENDMMEAGEFGYHNVSLNFRLATVDDELNAICRGRKMVIS
jgi:hypothetical protein